MSDPSVERGPADNTFGVSAATWFGAVVFWFTGNGVGAIGMAVFAAVLSAVAMFMVARARRRS